MDNNFFNKLLGLDDFIVTDVLEEDKNIIIYGHLKRKEHICPRCSAKTKEVKDTRLQLIKDIPAFGKNVFINLKKHRYICRKCNKSFLEENNFLQKYKRITNRTLEKIFLMTSQVLSFTQISKELNIPLPTLIRKFDLIQYAKTNLKDVEVLAIDEFKGNKNIIVF